MSGEARDTPGLDPAIDRAPPRRSRWGRRSPGRLDSGLGSDRGGPSYAALDLGTNNCRLLVARPTGDGFRVVDAFSRIIRLGEGVSNSRRLSEAAIERAIAEIPNTANPFFRTMRTASQSPILAPRTSTSSVRTLCSW